jgi:hypothetical protein
MSHKLFLVDGSTARKPGFGESGREGIAQEARHSLGFVSCIPSFSDLAPRPSIVLIDRTFADSAIDGSEHGVLEPANLNLKSSESVVSTRGQGVTRLCWNVRTRRTREGGFVALRSW